MTKIRHNSTSVGTSRIIIDSLTWILSGMEFQTVGTAKLKVTEDIQILIHNTLQPYRSEVTE